MTAKKIWTDKEINYLKKNYKILSLDTLAKHLNITIQSVIRKTKDLKLKNKAKFSKEGLKGLRQSKLSQNNLQWKGNNVSYNGLHQWIKRRKPKPKLCEKCKQNVPYDLANISGKYKRNIEDFEWLCRRCHMKNDNRLHNLEWWLKKHHKKICNCPNCKKKRRLNGKR